MEAKQNLLNECAMRVTSDPSGVLSIPDKYDVGTRYQPIQSGVLMLGETEHILMLRKTPVLPTISRVSTRTRPERAWSSSTTATLY